MNILKQQQIPSIDETEKIAIEQAVQNAADFLKKHDMKCMPIKARFPRGFIRTIVSLDKRWPYLSKERRRTLACAIQLCDVNRFHLNTWDLGLTAGTMWQWHCIMPIVALIETLLYEVGVQEGWFDKKTKFKKTIDTLNSKGVYGQKIRDRLHELREYRNEIHLYLKNDKVDMHDGKPQRYNEAVMLLHQVEKNLLAYFEKKKSKN